MSSHNERARRRALGLERMEAARRLLIADRADSAWFGAAAQAGKAGEYMVKNWFARCRVAMHNDGALLADEVAWGAYRREVELWPSLLWVGLLTADSLMNAAKACYGSGTGKLAMTTRTSETVTISPAAWVPRNLRRSSELEILAWCGVVGGTLPPVQQGPALQQGQ